MNAEENDEFLDIAYKYMPVSSIWDISDREIICEGLKKNMLQFLKCCCLNVIGIFYKKEEEGDTTAVLYQRRT